MDRTSSAWAALGLGPADREIYLSVLAGATDEAAIREQTGRTTREVAAALRSLREQGLIGSGADGGVVAGKPLLTLRRAAAHLHTLAGEILDESTHLQVLHDRTNIPERNRPDLQVLSSTAEVQRAFADLLSGAEEQVLACVKPPFLATGDFAEDEDEQLHRGVEFRVIYDPAALEFMGGLDQFTSTMPGGEQARVSDGIPLKMFIVDRQRALLLLSDDGSADDSGAVLVSGTGLVGALIALFETVWTRAWDLTDPPPPDGVVVDDRDRTIISALRLGATDEAIARRLGVTTRTVGRRIARLHELTDTRTRFQLGWRLARLTGDPQE
ncbi:hypothetical protein NF556_16060 [Ornithinimicrobium faecis]|uniref:HTH luxR-type domain-containing protein n=1 Tax=Ornithinimicrobium faecis TaxID=2934158 RepID=A0ABY4YQR9_9MICO|nr:TrmB family transcriptional regulator sugar-binding domain-containing protein [Ornithinimicrobium sp. HY1793]USQ79117.1 hypothetical protein NF556_16060 [Ornithinimicrobium sp. HY1793]